MKVLALTLSALALSSFSLACRTTNPDSESKFSAGEHVLLGNASYEAVCKKAGICPKDLLRKDGKVAFSYGELVAFSGDFYGTPESIYLEDRQRSIWSPFANDIAYAKNLFTQEASVIEQQMRGQEAKYPDFNVKFLIAYPGYLELSAKNTDHFGWHNMKAYVKYHSQALAAAAEARMKASDKSLLTKAIFYNAFADHFLTDAFATGHLRVPRSQAISWGVKKGYRAEAASGMAKVLHDNDHPFPTENGLPVTNARGDAWNTRGDSELYVDAAKESKALRLVQEAVAISLQEVLDVYQGKPMPSGVFRASELVPFVSDSAKKLTVAFPATMSEEEIRTKYLESLGIIWKTRVVTGMSTQLAADFFKDLPTLMSEFRMMVKADSMDPELSRRLPKAYLNGFMNVQ